MNYTILCQAFARREENTKQILYSRGVGAAVPHHRGAGTDHNENLHSESPRKKSLLQSPSHPVQKTAYTG